MAIEHSESVDPSPSQKPTPKIKPCCLETIKQHAEFNPMMVCPTCKQIIKRFESEASFRNYARFCESRKRPVDKFCINDTYIIIFRSYDTYS